MKQSYIARLIVMAISMSLLTSCDDGRPTLDATSGDTLVKSVKAMEAAMPSSDAKALDDAITGIVAADLVALPESVLAATGSQATGDPAFNEVLAKMRTEEQGKTGPEILAIAKARGIAPVGK